MNEIRWINPLDDEYTTYAAFVWKIGQAEAWGRLDRAIKNEELSNPIPFEEFKAYVQLAFFQPQQVIDTEKEKNQPTPISPAKPSTVGKIFIWLGNFIYIGGGILATLYSVYILAYLFGWVQAIIGLIVFPLTYVLLPFYTLFIYGDPTLLIINYGVGIAGFIFSFIGQKNSGSKETDYLRIYYYYYCWMFYLLAILWFFQRYFYNASFIFIHSYFNINTYHKSD